MWEVTHRRRATFERCCVFVGSVRFGVRGVVLVVCVCVGVGGVICRGVCVCDLFFFLCQLADNLIDLHFARLAIWHAAWTMDQVSSGSPLTRLVEYCLRVRQC